jgi:hypothetical protein
MSILISSSCRVLVSSSQLLNYDANDRTATDPYDANGKNVTVLQALKNIATNNLVNAAFPNGLVHVFQQASQFPIAYDEDNSEDYKGLEDFGNFLNSIGDSSASTYLKAAANIASRMQQTYTNNVYNGTTTNHNYLNLPGFLNAWQEDSGFTGPLPMSNPSPTFYPDGDSQNLSPGLSRACAFVHVCGRLDFPEINVRLRKSQCEQQRSLGHHWTCCDIQRRQQHGQTLCCRKRGTGVALQSTIGGSTVASHCMKYMASSIEALLLA